MSMGIEWYVWKPSNVDGFDVDKNYCRYSVSNSCGIGFHQCIRHQKVVVEGYGFCAQHAKIIQRYMDQYPIKYGWDKK